MNFSNYSTTCIDPSDGDLLWTYQGYANSKVDRQWCTAWAAFKFSAVAQAADKGNEPPQPIAASSETITGTAARSVLVVVRGQVDSP